ncbi:MAG: hypothetical protein DMG06_16420 [Acidobacteria bacterium]|nr:MAG: hypothetical protein DMG06_16420 [Acidobacteriota bacterium]
MSVVLRSVVCVCLDIRIWSGKKKLTPSDLQLSESKLPPQEIATLGSKNLCDPSALQPLNRIESQARDCCAKVGVRFLNGFGVPKAKAPELLSQLAALQREFQQGKDLFLNLYEDTIRDWAAAHPGWEYILRTVVPKTVVESKIGFDFQAFTVSEPIFKEDESEETCDSQGARSSAANGLLKATHELPETLFAEIAQNAKDTWRRSFEGKSVVTRKALRPVKTLVTKLELMKFLSPQAIEPLTQRIQQRLSSLAKNGPIAGNDLAIVSGIVYALSDLERLKTYTSLLQNGLPLDEAAFLKGQNVFPAKDTSTVPEPHELIVTEPEEEAEPAPTTIAQTTGWFSW